mmetsp:Transcript_31029/g.56265  ORF Transcript_31029/g.56265 Transcript_31029/m.56265 type:complete len:252 (-) Transcript_31029:1224-1979(-)
MNNVVEANCSNLLRVLPSWCYPPHSCLHGGVVALVGHQAVVLICATTSSQHCLHRAPGQRVNVTFKVQLLLCLKRRKFEEEDLVCARTDRKKIRRDVGKRQRQDVAVDSCFTQLSTEGSNGLCMPNLQAILIDGHGQEAVMRQSDGAWHKSWILVLSQDTDRIHLPDGDRHVLTAASNRIIGPKSHAKHIIAVLQRYWLLFYRTNAFHSCRVFKDFCYPCTPLADWHIFSLAIHMCILCMMIQQTTCKTLG